MVKRIGWAGRRGGDWDHPGLTRMVRQRTQRFDGYSLRRTFGQQQGTANCAMRLQTDRPMGFKSGYDVKLAEAYRTAAPLQIQLVDATDQLPRYGPGLRCAFAGIQLRYRLAVALLGAIKEQLDVE